MHATIQRRSRAPTPTRNRSTASSSAGVIAGLLLFAAMPLTFGVLRILQLAGIAGIMPPVPGTFGLVAPLVTHIASAFVYAMLGAFQFSSGLRRRWPAWHRYAGRLAWVAGLLVALSALWLTAEYFTSSPGSIVLAGLRVAVASMMLLSLGLGLVAILRHDIQHHRAWMIRAYALGLGSATQMLVLMVAEMINGVPPSDLGRAVLMGLAWTINLAFAEWVIRRNRSPGGSRPRWSVAGTNEVRPVRVPQVKTSVYLEEHEKSLGRPPTEIAMIALTTAHQDGAEGGRS